MVVQGEADTRTALAALTLRARLAPTGAPAQQQPQQQQQQRSKPQQQQQQQATAAGMKADATSKGAKKADGAGESAKKPKAAAPAAPAAPAVSPEEAERRFQLLRSVGEECVTEEDLRNLVSKKPSFRLYDGFEPSGRMHIAQGIFKALNVNKCTSAGGRFVFWVADWFALMNDKMGGDLDKIKVVGQYFIEVWKGAGMDLDNVEFRWASDDIIDNAGPYWDQMLDITKRFTIARIKKCCQIMGRLENKLTAAQVLYPIMQCTDIFFLRADICQLGVDQRKVNMLAREYCDFIGRKLKPVILSHHMLYGLAEGQAKMSKSNPDSAIFMEDPVSEVERKLDIAYCPREAKAKSADDPESLSLVEDDLKNPCLDYVQHIVMTQPNAVFAAGGREYPDFESARAAFLSGELAEQDLKRGLAACVNTLMQPVRDHFASDPHAKRVLELVREYKREEAKPPTRLKRMGKLGAAGSLVVVMAPCPASPRWSLSEVLSTKAALKRAREEAAAGGGELVLYLPDLNAIALNCFGEDKKRKATDCIAAAYAIFLAALGAFEGVLAGVRVLRQSEAMLMDPSDYWVSVINVGRRFQLDRVHEAVGLEEGRVGAIVAALMHVGDVLALAPRCLVTPEGPAGFAAQHELAVEYVRMCADQADAIAPPAVLRVPTASAVTSGVGAPNVIELLLADKLKPDVKKKFKQAFCEPGNTEDSPVLALAESLVFADGGSLEVVTAEGPRTFADLASLRAAVGTPLEGRDGDFLVHPADLKQAVAPAVDRAYTALAKAMDAVDKKMRDLVDKYRPAAAK
mmetsp:Transcript_10487/g.33533  ORF Transcript_10487/g.33533 Transcript_10487/m.33533 type:complete len:800 (-) Transcript_10487:352-2751(-)